MPELFKTPQDVSLSATRQSTQDIIFRFSPSLSKHMITVRFVTTRSMSASIPPRENSHAIASDLIPPLQQWTRSLSFLDKLTAWSSFRCIVLPVSSSPFRMALKRPLFYTLFPTSSLSLSSKSGILIAPGICPILNSEGDLTSIIGVLSDTLRNSVTSSFFSGTTIRN